MKAAVVVVVTALATTAACSTSRPTPTALPSPSATPTELVVASASPSPDLTGAPVPTPTSPTAPAVASPPVVVRAGGCASGQLRLSLGSTDGGAGQFHQPLVFTDIGGPCTLRGYPGVSFLAGGRQLGDPAAQTGAPAPTVSLRTGGRATAVLTYSNAGAYPSSVCRPQQSSTVRVYPPGQRTALTAADSVLVCTASGSSQLHIDPVTAG